MKPATYAPAYAALYPKLAEIAREHGYAMAVHGSMARDLDVCCIPWVDEPSEPQAVVDAITSQFTIRTIGEPEVKKHGRLVYTVSVGFGECAIDLSFMPRLAATQAPAVPDEPLRERLRKAMSLAKGQAGVWIEWRDAEAIVGSAVPATDARAEPMFPFAGFDPKFCPGSNPDNPQEEPDRATTAPAEAPPTIKGAWIDGGYVIVTPAGWGDDKAIAVKAAILAHFPVDPKFTPQAASTGGKS